MIRTIQTDFEIVRTAELGSDEILDAVERLLNDGRGTEVDSILTERDWDREGSGYPNSRTYFGGWTGSRNFSDNGKRRWKPERI